MYRVDGILLTDAVVLVEHAVSLTCSVQADGRTRWWLTRETGMLIPRCSSVSCFRCTSVDRVDAQSYLVLKVFARGAARYEVLFSHLSLETLCVVHHRLVPALQEGGWLSSVDALHEFFWFLDEGGCYGGRTLCVCHGSSLDVVSAGTNGRLFFLVTQFRGVFSHQGGVFSISSSDAVDREDEVDDCRLQWFDARDCFCSVCGCFVARCVCLR